MEAKDRNGSEPAYPQEGWGNQNEKVYGLTKRELIAAMVLQGLCSNPHPDVQAMASLEKAAVLFADELLKQLSNGN